MLAMYTGTPPDDGTPPVPPIPPPASGIGVAYFPPSEPGR